MASPISLAESSYLDISPDWKSMYVVVSGRVEAYAVTHSGSKRFHKVFLAELENGEKFFPLAQAKNGCILSLLALEDSIIEQQPLPLDDSADNTDNTDVINKWFGKIALLPWMAESGDEVVFSSQLDENNRILADRLSLHFRLLEEREDAKAAAYKNKQGNLMANTHARHLDGGEGLFHTGGDSREGGQPLQNTVKLVVQYFGMDPRTVHLPAGIAARLDPVTLLRKYAENGGMRLRLARLEHGWHESDSGVLIGFSGKEREVSALLPDSSGSYRIFNSSNPHGALVNDQLAAAIGGEVFVCYAGLPPKPLSIRQLLTLAISRTWKNDWHSIILISLVAGLLPLVMPLITDSIFSDIIPINDRQALGTVTQVMLVSGFAAAILSLVRAVTCLRLKNHLDQYLLPALWSRLLTLPARFFRKFQVGDLAQRMDNIGKFTDVLNSAFATSFFNVVFSFWSFALMLYYSVRLTFLASVVWIVYLVIVSLVYRKTQEFRRNETSASYKTMALVVQILGGLETFKLRGSEEQAFALWVDKFGSERKWKIRLRRQQNRISIVNAVQPVVLTMVVYFATMKLYFFDPYTLPMERGEFMAFQTLFTSFNATMMAFIPMILQLLAIRPHIENIRPLLEATPEATGDKTEASVLRGDIDVKNLFFSYDPDSPMVLKDISFSVKAGESVAFVGPSGCGKSTLLRLLLGFEHPVQGAIYYDGEDLSTLNAASVRSQMGVVLQTGQLMSGDIFTNIVGTTPLGMDDAWQAARLVGLDKEIEAMPMGMFTYIGEGGGNLSGGQRQRILIARSIVAKPRIVILDEATSAVDNLTQKVIADSINSLKATRIVVAHRLSTIREADRIYVMDRGRIIESGAFDDLISKDGLFARLARRQLE